ncbi:MAG: GTPase Era [Bacilli bacterium]
MRSGIVSLVGRPNVGKSTLLNTIINAKVAITSDKAGTTRNITYGIYNDNDTQIVFVDTPGIHKPMNKLGELLNKKAYSNGMDAEIILFLVDASTGIGRGDIFILDRLKTSNKKIILLLNKVDLIKKELLLKMISDMNELYSFSEIIPISALKGDNVLELIETIKPYLTNDFKYFPDDMITNVTTSFLASELIREKVLELTTDEVPHAITCIVEKYEEKESLVRINALIVVDRESLKKIIIGKNGSMIKQIGTLARLDIEKMVGKKVYLEIFVKTIKSWRDSERHFSELGLKDFE